MDKLQRGIDEIKPEIEDVIKVAVVNHTRECCLDSDSLQARSMLILEKMDEEISLEFFCANF